MIHISDTKYYNGIAVVTKILEGGVSGLVQSWAAIVMGMLSGSIPWVSMMILHKKSTLLQKVRLSYSSYDDFLLPMLSFL